MLGYPVVDGSANAYANQNVDPYTSHNVHHLTFCVNNPLHSRQVFLFRIQNRRSQHKFLYVLFRSGSSNEHATTYSQYQTHHYVNDGHAPVEDAGQQNN